MFRDYIVDQIPGRVGQHEAGDLVDDHQHKTESEQPAARTHQLPDFRQNSP